MKTEDLTLIIVIALAFHLMIPESAKPLVGWICGAAFLINIVYGAVKEARR